MKKRSEETQTLRAGCSKAEPKKFRPVTDPLPGSRDGQNLIRETITTFTYKPSLVRIDARNSSYRGNRPTSTQTHTPTHTWHVFVGKLDVDDVFSRLRRSVRHPTRAIFIVLALNVRLAGALDRKTQTTVA